MLQISRRRLLSVACVACFASVNTTCSARRTIYGIYVRSMSTRFAPVNAEDLDDEPDYDAELSQTKKTFRMAVFGTDNFSLYSIRRLYDMKMDPENPLGMLHIITREPKPKARHMELVEASPAEKFARAHQIPVFYCESNAMVESLLQFRYDLVAAVSYGRMIPENFLAGIKYGGINIHPSFLPQLRGPAPIHWALINRLPVTGVTCQSLHPRVFDAGRILARSEEVPITEDDNVETLRHKLAELGADLLENVINTKVYEIPDYQLLDADRYPESYAPPIESRHKVLNLNDNSVSDILVKYKALGTLHLFHEGTVTVKPKLTKRQKRKKKNSAAYAEELKVLLPPIKEDRVMRVKITNPVDACKYFPDIEQRLLDFVPGQYDFLTPEGTRDDADLKMVIRVSDGFIAADEIIVEGYAACSAHQYKLSMNKRGLSAVQKFVPPPSEALLPQKERTILSRQIRRQHEDSPYPTRQTPVTEPVTEHTKVK